MPPESGREEIEVRRALTGKNKGMQVTKGVPQ